MYDPVLARFVSADSVVPGTASGSLQGIALKPLTVDFHEVGFGATLNGENGQPCWFQLSDTQRQQVGDPWGPQNPQALNRYSYVLNAPVRWTDPRGHDNRCYTAGCASVVINNSSHPVEIRGDRRIPGCNAPSNSCIEKDVVIVLGPGESSADYGYTDVDGIRPIDASIDGHGRDDFYDVPEKATVTITDDPNGGLHLEDSSWSVDLYIRGVFGYTYGWKNVAEWEANKDGKKPREWGRPQQRPKCTWQTLAPYGATPVSVATSCDRDYR
jgi:hypothetical protein